MSQAITCKLVRATSTLPQRVKAESFQGTKTVNWNYDLTDTANYRLAANYLLRDINAAPHNERECNVWEIIAGAQLPSGKEYVFTIVVV